MKKTLLCLMVLLSIYAAKAQSTETFETETSGSTTFTDNGQSFTITTQAGGTFDIQAAYPGTGWNGTAADNRYIDNDGYATGGVPIGFTISTSNGVPFYINRVFMYFSNYALNQSVSGSLTVTGKRSGVTKFTATKNSGFNTSQSTTNGFTDINFLTFGGSNNTGTPIDQLVFSTTGAFEYVALDAFTWTIAPLPVTLTRFAASFDKKEVSVSWETASEINNKEFTVLRSSDNTTFETIATITGAGNSSKKIAYTVTDAAAQSFAAAAHSPVIYYRLKQTDFDGRFTTSASVPVAMQTVTGDAALVFPNPFSGGSIVLQADHVLSVTDAQGKSKSFTAHESEAHIMLSGCDSWEPGLYLIAMEKQGRRITQRVLKQ